MMGKSRKVSKGYSSSFLPDYRHVVETMAKSEGFVNSGRVEPEKIDLDKSCARKKKHIGLNVDSYDLFGVPCQILSLSKMSQFERKGLECRLKHELEQIRTLQKKIASMSTSVVALSAASDIYSCSDGQSRSVAPKLAGESASKGKKRARPGRNHSRTKRPAAAGRLEPAADGSLPRYTHDMLMEQCATLLNRLMMHRKSGAFNSPVDVVGLSIPDYYTVIKNPMDLGTVKSKLTSGEYSSPLEFAADVRLTFSNARTYNPPGNIYHEMAKVVSKYFEMRWKLIEKKLPVMADGLVISKSSSLTGAEFANLVPPSKSTYNTCRQEPVKCVITDVQKRKLIMELEALLDELPENIIDFLKEKSSDGEQTCEDEIEIDIDTLCDDNLFTLQKLLDAYLAEKMENETEAKTCEMERHNESEISNLSVQPCRGNDMIDEDVDISGNDLPISSFLPVEIKRDVNLSNSKFGNSCTTSSESGSLSSDSDSGSSSGSETDAKASVPANTTKETSASGANLEVRESHLGDPGIENDSLSDMNQVELKFQYNPVSVETSGHQEGESAPPERQVSPEKLYRAALLRSRFADTILKAQETTQGKDLRSRLEKEELQRRRREEKARLQAEAKAAEEAQRKAEAEAAAESKIKIELEREAARQALQKMEKTVDISANHPLVEDLEMLRFASTEQLQSFLYESPDHSLEDLGSFKFQGNSNPLEQLGLYMKADDDEEEGEPENVPPVVTIREEGEID